MAIGQWLIDDGKNLGRPIASLRIEELEGMAWAAIGAWQEMREQRRQELNAPPAPTDPRQIDPLDDDIPF